MNIKIRTAKNVNGETQETTIEINGTNDYVVDYVKAILETLKQQNITVDCVDSNNPIAEKKPRMAVLRRAGKESYISPELLRKAFENKMARDILQPLDEIDIPLTSGKTATVICSYAGNDWARFVSKKCFDEGPMNVVNTNAGGYFASDGRKHVLEVIWPQIAPEWRAIVSPRCIIEGFSSGDFEKYHDPIWLLSDSDANYIFPTVQGMSRWIEEATTALWLRNTKEASTNAFYTIKPDSLFSYNEANAIHGFAPGFDVGLCRSLNLDIK